VNIRMHRGGQDVAPTPDWLRPREETNRQRRDLAELDRQHPAREAAPASPASRSAGGNAKRSNRRAPRGVPGSLRVPRAVALWTVALLVGSASLTSFAESYRGLVDWAHEHGLSGLWAAVWPLQVDVFIAVGELALFVALADSWSRRSRIGAWTVTLGGLAVSVAGNVGHVHSVLLSDRATAAIPPLAAAAALAVGLGVLKRVVEAHAQNASEGGPLDARRDRTPASPGAEEQPTVARGGGGSRERVTPARRAPRRPSAADLEARALAEMARQPDISGADLGRAIGASPRTGQRLLSRLSERADSDTSST
jgi:hypothetical protein